MNTKFLDQFVRVVVALVFVLGMAGTPATVVQAEDGNPSYEAALETFENAETEDECMAAIYLAQQIFTADLLTDTAYVKSLSYAETSCNANAITDEIELTVTGGTSLRYDTQSGQFIYNWKTPSTVNKCYRVTIITQDGSALLAYFKLK
jgi:hypothetical protein